MPMGTPYGTEAPHKTVPEFWIFKPLSVRGCNNSHKIGLLAPGEELSFTSSKWTRNFGSILMIYLDWQELDDVAAARIVSEVNVEAPYQLPAGKTKIKVASVPFYDDYKFYSMADTTLPTPNERRPGAPHPS